MLDQTRCSQRALRSKKCNPGLKFSISIEHFNPGVSIYGALLVYREGLDQKFQSTIDRSKISIPKAAIESFQSPGPLGSRTFVRMTERGGLSLRGAAVTTETATTTKSAQTVKTVTAASLSCSLWDQQKEGKVLSTESPEPPKPSKPPKPS